MQSEEEGVAVDQVVQTYEEADPCNSLIGMQMALKILTFNI